MTIPGVGPATAATLMAEIGDIHRFDDVDQLLAYAGVHPKEQSSGKKGANPETSWAMAKTGNAYLRTAAYRMAWSASSTTSSSVSTTLESAPPVSPR
jgi:transposase